MNYFEQARFNMVEQQIRPWSVLDFDVLDALAEVPREQFVTPEQQAYAYADLSLPLPNGSAMLEPKVVARLIQGLKLTKKDTVLEIGTGSGYATAVLAKLAGRVITIDTDEAQQHGAQRVSGLPDLLLPQGRTKTHRVIGDQHPKLLRGEHMPHLVQGNRHQDSDNDNDNTDD